MQTSSLKFITVLLYIAVTIVFPTTTFSTPRCEGKLLRKEIAERQNSTIVLLRDKKFKELQAKMDGFLDAYTSNQLSDEELAFEFLAFNIWGPSYTPLIQEWMKRYPKSFAAVYAMSLHTAAIAWNIRGDKFANGTSFEQFAQFKPLLLTAQEFALRAIKLHRKPILAYQQLMFIGKAMPFEADLLPNKSVTTQNTLTLTHIPRPDLIPILEESIRLQPDNIIVREAYVAALAPRWGGSLEALIEYSEAATHNNLSPDRIASVTYTAMLEMASDYWKILKDLDKAANAYAAATNICNLNQPFVEIAYIRLEQNRFEEALTAAEAAIKIVPESSVGARLKTRALFGLGRHKEAVGLLQKLAPEGDLQMLEILGWYYETGQGGLEKDVKEARRLYGIAARNGYEPAIKRLETLKPEK